MMDAVTPINAADELCELLETQRDHDFILVMDLHKEWTGPCAVLRQTYAALPDTIEKDGAAKVAVVSTASEKLAAWLNATPLKSSKSAKFNPEQVKEKIFRGLPSVLSETEKAKVGEHLDKAKSSCKPQTLFFRCMPSGDSDHNVILVDSVHGADAPTICQTFQKVVSQCSL